MTRIAKVDEEGNRCGVVVDCYTSDDGGDVFITTLENDLDGHTALACALLTRAEAIAFFEESLKKLRSFE